METDEEIKKRKPTWQSLLRNTLDKWAPQPASQPSVQPGSMDNRQKFGDAVVDDDADRLVKKRQNIYGIAQR